MLRTDSPVKDVVDVLNIVRNRAGATPLKASDYPDRESLMNEIFNENLREIGMENGALYYLAVRMRVGGKRLLKTWNDNYEKDDQNNCGTEDQQHGITMIMCQCSYDSDICK